MAYRNLFLKNGRQLGTFQGGRARLVGTLCEEGPPSAQPEWTPKRAEVANLVAKTVEVERLNLPGSK